MKAPQTSAPQSPIGRIPVQNVRPCVDHGKRPAKSVVGEEFDVTATVFREGHDAVNATLVVTDPDGQERAQLMTCLNPGLNHWAGPLVADREGWWSYRVEGWSDPWGTWHHNAEAKLAAGVDLELVLCHTVVETYSVREAATLAARAVEVRAGSTRVVLAPSPMARELDGVLELAVTGGVHAQNALAAALAASSCF